MREILFRGKRTDNGEWVYGAFSEYDVEQSGQEMLTVHNPCIIDYGNELLWTEVVPETVGQYTGLTDKNGKKIFEGDIVMIVRRPDYLDYAGVDYNALITFAKGGFCITNGKLGLLCQAVNMGDFEVIGSIHDNPELLEDNP